jgi:long-subunit fatty acid transport protein
MVINMKKYYTLLLLLIIIKPIYSQPVAAEFLGLQQSPLLIGAGQIGAAIPMKDASGFYYNPAQLGYFSHENNISVFFCRKTHIGGI